MKTFKHDTTSWTSEPYESGDRIKLKGTNSGAACIFVKYRPCQNYYTRHLNCQKCVTNRNALLVRGDIQTWESCSTNSYGELRWRILE